MRTINLTVLFTRFILFVFILAFAAGCKKDDNKPETVKDIEGNVYEIVKIGNQEWMAENLRVTRFNDGIPIPLVTDVTAWSSLDSPAYCWNNNDENNLGVTFGAFYNFYAVDVASNGGKNICPVGWHVATDGEWTSLVDYLGGEDVAGGEMKSKGTVYWEEPNEGATNSSGFTALPGGDRFWDGHFYNLSTNAHFWTSTQVNENNAWYFGMVYSHIKTYLLDDSKISGLSIRCVKD